MAALKRCKANIGTRAESRACGQPVIEGMLACCEQHRTALIPTSTPGIYTRGGVYVVVWRHRGKQHKSFHRTLAEAREAKGERQAGSRRPTTKVMFEDYVRAWLDSYQGRTARGLDDGSRDGYRHALELHAIPFFAGWRLAEIEQKDIRRFVAHLQEQRLAAASVRKYMAPVKAMFATAVEEGELPAGNPTLGVRINARRDHNHEDAPEPAKAMTREQLRRVLAALPPRWQLPFELLAHTGLRISELLGLDWTDVELGERPHLLVRRQFYRRRLKRYLKSGAGRRELPLSPAMARKLATAKPPNASGAIFATKSGTRLDDHNLRRTLDRVTHPQVRNPTRNRTIVPALAGPDLEWVTFHTFRHTCASILLDSGKNIRQVAAWLGHEDPSFTLRTYTHLIDAGLGDAQCFDALDPNIQNEESAEIMGNKRQRANTEKALRDN